MTKLIIVLIYIIGAPILGGLLSGIDRKITARMQGRVGPPIIQPFYDFFKLLQKETLVVRRSQNLYILFYLIMTIFTGVIFFAGENLLLVIFALTLAEIFLVLGAFKASSPYSTIGAHRELIQIMSSEPTLIFCAIGMYLTTKSFHVSHIITSPQALFLYLPGLLIALILTLVIKLRKSPFDLSTSHHAHQELVKGLTTEFSGKALAMIEIAHWYDSIIMFGIVYLFFGCYPVFGLIAASCIFSLVLLIDNTTARIKWQLMLKSCWLISMICGFINVMIVYYVMR
ncbi:MAG: NADH-quinone oxidoreductase subunit H [Candidatus Ancaeobacter aquaticus]|nr:NADH-quinone oxidoreductase subunit H [Candidatus Ancaeobacter aquaticus]